MLREDGEAGHPGAQGAPGITSGPAYCRLLPWLLLALLSLPETLCLSPPYSSWVGVSLPCSLLRKAQESERCSHQGSLVLRATTRLQGPHTSDCEASSRSGVCELLRSKGQ